MWYYRRWEIYIFHLILMMFFLTYDSTWELSVVLYILPFSSKRGSIGGIQFRIIWKKNHFSSDFDGVTYENFNKSDTSFEDNTGQNYHLSSHITVSSTSMCLAYYCGQQNSVFKITISSFVHLSHVNVLWSDHASPQFMFNRFWFGLF